MASSEMQTAREKKPYVTPQLTRFGNALDLTAGGYIGIMEFEDSFQSGGPYTCQGGCGSGT